MDCFPQRRGDAEIQRIMHRDEGYRNHEGRVVGGVPQDRLLNLFFSFRVSAPLREFFLLLVGIGFLGFLAQKGF